MTLKAPKTVTTSHNHNGSLLTISNGLSFLEPPTALALKMYHSALSEKLADFAEGLKNEDLKDIQELGWGNGGSIKKAEHTPTGMIMVKACVSHPPPLPSSLPSCFCLCSIHETYNHP
jgi:mitogen-activated protein kinase kinase